MYQYTTHSKYKRSSVNGVDAHSIHSRTYVLRFSGWSRTVWFGFFLSLPTNAKVCSSYMESGSEWATESVREGEREREGWGLDRKERKRGREGERHIIQYRWNGMVYVLIVHVTNLISHECEKFRHAMGWYQRFFLSIWSTIILFDKFVNYSLSLFTHKCSDEKYVLWTQMRCRTSRWRLKLNGKSPSPIHGLNDAKSDGARSRQLIYRLAGATTTNCWVNWIAAFFFSFHPPFKKGAYTVFIPAFKAPTLFGCGAT